MQTQTTEPAWLITTPDNKVIHGVPFSDLHKQKDQILSATLLWRVNSYHVDLRRKTFVINGGRLLHIKGLGDNILFEYARRTKLQLKTMGPVDNNSGERVVTYLIGMKSDSKDILVEISEDGSSWRWLDAR